MGQKWVGSKEGGPLMTKQQELGRGRSSLWRQGPPKFYNFSKFWRFFDTIDDGRNSLIFLVRNVAICTLRKKLTSFSLYKITTQNNYLFKLNVPQYVSQTFGCSHLGVWRALAGQGGVPRLNSCCFVISGCPPFDPTTKSPKKMEKSWKNVKTLEGPGGPGRGFRALILVVLSSGDLPLSIPPTFAPIEACTLNCNSAKTRILALWIQKWVILLWC